MCIYAFRNVVKNTVFIWWGVGNGVGGSASLTFRVPAAHWDLSAGIIIRI